MLREIKRDREKETERAAVVVCKAMNHANWLSATAAASHPRESCHKLHFSSLLTEKYTFTFNPRPKKKKKIGFFTNAAKL